MKVTFLQDYRGKLTDEAYYEEGETVDLADEQADALVKAGRARYAGEDKMLRPNVENKAAQLMMALPDDVSVALTEAGYTTLQELREASDDELLAVHGIGPATLRQIREATE